MNPPERQVRVERARFRVEARCHDAPLDRSGELLERLAGPDLENHGHRAAPGGEDLGAAELEAKWAQRGGLRPNAVGDGHDPVASDFSEKAKRHVEGLRAHPANLVAARAGAQLVGHRRSCGACVGVEIDREKSADAFVRLTQSDAPLAADSRRTPRSMAAFLSTLRPHRADELHAQQGSPDPVERNL